MRRKVLYAKFHQSVFIPGLGDFGTTAPPASKTFPDLKITYVDDLVIYLESRGVTGVVPLGNVAVCTLAPEETEASSK